VTNSNILNNLATWLASVSLESSPQSISARKETALELASKIAPSDLVESAYFAPVSTVVDLAETELLAKDETHVSGKNRELVRVLASAAILVQITDDNAGTLFPLLSQSARFMGGSAPLDELDVCVDEIVAATARRSRARVALAAPSPTVKKLSTTAVDAAPESESTGNVALAHRVEELARTFQSRLDLLDEEVDALWWSKRNRTESGDKWKSLDPVERAVRATLEVIQLVRHYPPTKALIEVLSEVVDSGSKETTDLTSVAVVVANAGWVGTSQGRLIPISTAVRLVQEHEGNEAAIAELIRASLPIAADFQFPLSELPEQLLREISIGAAV
jgi:hypothetical protein